MRLRTLALVLLALAACEDKHPDGELPSRYAAVTRAKPVAQAARFCDRSWAAHDPAAPKYRAPPTRPLPGAAEAPEARGWRWVNAWATWCAPCVGEMALLGRWQKALEKEGLPISLELVSIDATDAQPELQKWVARGALPGALRWLRAEDDFGPWMESLGLEKGASIPVHALVDPDGQLRCVRTGAIHEEDYGQVKALLSAR